MKNAFTNALLCGVLASTFLIVNCQKAPDRGVKADVSPNAKAAGAPKLGTCTAEALAALAARNEKATELQTLINAHNDANEPPADEAIKQQLQNLATELRAKTDAAVTEIQKIKVGDANADGCNEMDATDQTKVKERYVIQALRDSDRRIGAAVQALTESPNALVEEAPSADAPQGLEIIPAPVSDDVTIADGSEMLIAKEELATILKDARSKDGESFIVNAALQTGAQNFQEAVANKNITICKVNVAVSNAAVDTEIKVVSVDDIKTEGEGQAARSVLDVNLQVGTEATVLSCAIADSARANAAQAVRATLGDMVKKKEATTEELTAPPPVAPSSGDSSSASGDASSASGDSSAADDAADSVLNGDAAPSVSGDSSAASGDSTAASGDNT